MSRIKTRYRRILDDAGGGFLVWMLLALVGIPHPDAVYFYGPLIMAFLSYAQHRQRKFALAILALLELTARPAFASVRVKRQPPFTEPEDPDTETTR